MNARATTCHYAVAVFLRAELDSPTQASRLRDVLRRLQVNHCVIATPDVSNAHENSLRWRVFESYRGKESLFDTLDLRELTWLRTRMTEAELRGVVRTCRHHFETVHGTRDPGRIALTLTAQAQPNGVIDRINNGEQLAEPLLVSTPALNQFVILEGHNRIISYLRSPLDVNFPLPVIVGYSTSVSAWREW